MPKAKKPIDKKLRAQVESLLLNASIASVRSWLKAKKKKSSAASRDALIDRVTSLLQESDLTFAELEDGIVGIEEAGGKKIVLFELENKIKADDIAARLKKENIELKKRREISVVKAKPHLVYVIVDGPIIRVKWTEMHYRPIMVVDENDVIHHRKEPIPKVIVLVANVHSKKAEIRFDRPEQIHPHKNANTHWKESYASHYVSEAEKILGTLMSKSALGEALRKLIKAKPYPIRLHIDGHTNQRNLTFKVSAKSGDIRDDPEWQAMYGIGGNDWAHDHQAFYWRPEESKGRLSREVFSYVDALSGSVNVEADCWDAEVDYVVEKIRNYQ
jgi:hypothetical protein